MCLQNIYVKSFENNGISIKFEKIKSGWSIVYIERLQVIVSKIFISLSISEDQLYLTVVPTKSDSDVILCSQLFSKTLTHTLHLG